MKFKNASARLKAKRKEREERRKNMDKLEIIDFLIWREKGNIEKANKSQHKHYHVDIENSEIILEALKLLRDKESESDE